MTQFLIHFLGNFRGPAVYVGVLFILILCGLGVPLPEDVPLIAGGFFVGGAHIPFGMVAIGLLGILIGDSIIFRAGQAYGEKLLETKLGKHIPGERVQRTVYMFERHGPKFIMVARFVPGLRAVTYFVAGTTGVPYWKFITFDGIAACVSAPLWVILGWYARRGGRAMMRKVLHWSSRAELLVIGIIAAAVVIWLLTSWYLRKRRRARGEPTDPGMPAVKVKPIDLAARR